MYVHFTVLRSASPCLAAKMTTCRSFLNFALVLRRRLSASASAAPSAPTALRPSRSMQVARRVLCTCQASSSLAGPSTQRLASTHARRPDARSQTRASIALARKHDDLSFADRRPARKETPREFQKRRWDGGRPVVPLYVELRRTVRAFRSADDLEPMLKALARTLSIDENELVALYGTWSKAAEGELGAAGRDLNRLPEACVGLSHRSADRSDGSYPRCDSIMPPRAPRRCNAPSSANSRARRSPRRQPRQLVSYAARSTPAQSLTSPASCRPHSP